MDFRLAVLSVIAGLLLAAAPVAKPAPSRCLACHAPHRQALGACEHCHRGNPRTERMPIAHHRLIGGRLAHFNLDQSPTVAAGQDLVATFACRRCHRIAGQGNRLAAPLDRVLTRDRVSDLVAAIQAPAAAMPDFYFNPDQADQIVNALLSHAAASPSTGTEAPLVVHFENNTPNREKLFERHCGSCHRLLTREAGGVGRGQIGPNLSGLLSAFYPRSFKNNQDWNSVGLQQWIENPRNIRPNARMRPLELEKGEFTRLLGLFRD